MGDAAFQKKCLGKMGEVARAGRTVLFVSHNMNAVVRLCDRVVRLHQGEIADQGDPGGCVDAYLADLTQQTTAAVGEMDAQGGCRLESVRILALDETLPLARPLRFGESFVVESTWSFAEAVYSHSFLVRMETRDGSIITTMNSWDQGFLITLPSTGRVVVRWQSNGNPLVPGEYLVSLEAHDARHMPVAAYWAVASVEVSTVEAPPRLAKTSSRAGKVLLPGQWAVLDSGSGGQQLPGTFESRCGLPRDSHGDEKPVVGS